MIDSMSVIVPTRGRPANARRLVEAWGETTTQSTKLILAIDDDDPKLHEYCDIPIGPQVMIAIGPRLRLGGTLNQIAPVQAELVDAVGFMGDDHLPRTVGWDKQIIDALSMIGTGVAYGNDLIRGGDLPTAAFLTSDIIRKTGHMVPPGLVHLYLDDYWRALGVALAALAYLPDVVIEHLHPTAGKAEPDAGYAEVNAPELYERDRATFDHYLREHFRTDLDKIRA